MCRARRDHTAEGGCLLFFRFLAILATIGGITLIAIGASNYGQNELHRSQQVENYINAVSSSTNPWTDTSSMPTASASQAQGSAEWQRFVSQTSIVYPSNGDDRDVSPITTRLLTTTLFPWFPASPLKVSLTSAISSITDNLTVVIPFTKLMTAPIECDIISCASDCSGGGVKKCTNSSLTQACKATYNDLAYYIGDPECDSNGGECGTCYFPAYLSTACLVVAPTDNGGYVFDRTMGSCFFPFTVDSQHYEATFDVSLGSAVQRHVTVELRANTDPYIYLQRATLGKMNFPSRNVAVPSILMGIGIGLIVSFWVGLGCCRAWQRRREKDAEDCELQTTQPIPMAPYPMQHTAVSVPSAAPPQPVEGVFYGQGPVPMNPNPLPNLQVPQVGSDPETYPGVPIKPLHR